MKKGIIAGLFLLLAGTVFASAFSRDYISVENFTALKAELKYEGIVVEGTNDDEIKLEIRCNNHYKMPEISVEDGVLLIKNVKKGTYAENCTVYVSIPEDILPEYIEISTLSGDIEVNNVYAQTFMLEAASGDIDCKNIEIEGEIHAKASSGDITLNSVTADEIVVKVSSGDIELKSVECDQLELEVVSGDIDAERISVNKLVSTSKSGTQEIEKIDCKVFEIESTSGSVKLKMNDVPEQDSSIVSASGNVDIRLPKTSKFQMEVASKSGSFDDDFDSVSFRPRGNVLSKYNGGGVLITVETKSGNISLDD